MLKNMLKKYMFIFLLKNNYQARGGTQIKQLVIIMICYDNNVMVVVIK